jgi:hypothetical protein
MKKLLEKAVIKPDLLELSKVAAGTAAFMLLLIAPPPPFFSRAFHQPDWTTWVFLFIFLTLLLRKKGNGWETIQAVVIFGLFAISLIYKWQFAHYDGFIIGGLLPWSDASNYFWDAHLLNLGLNFSPLSTMRPLSTAFLSVMLRLTTGNLMITLACLTLLNALAVFFTLQIVKRLYGSAAASAFILLTYAFYERFSGQTTTEQLGFALGNLALFFLLAGGFTKSLWRALLGLGLLTLALNARAGAFLILPALVLWIALYFVPKKGFLRVAGLAVAVVVLGFALNLLLVKNIGSKNGVAFSNFSYIVYSLASGNQEWTAVYKDYPNVTEAEVMPLAIQKIRQNPGLLIKGIVAAYGDYFKLSYGAFSFIYPDSPPDSPRIWVYIPLWGFTLVGLASAALHWRERLAGLVLFSFLGIFASASMAAPLISNSMRAYAATIPFTALWVAVGISVIFVRAKKLLMQKESDSIENIGLPYHKLVLSLSALLIVLAVPAPFLLKAFPVKVSGPSISLLQPACGSAQELIQGFVFKDTSIILIQDDAASESYMPFIRLGDFQNTIISTPSGYPFLDEELLDLKAGNRISFGLRLGDAIPTGYLWMISKFTVGEGKLSLCGQLTDNENLQPHGFYHLKGPTVRPSSLTISQQHPTATLVIRLLYGLGLGLLLFILITDMFSFKRQALAK